MNRIATACFAIAIPYAGAGADHLSARPRRNSCRQRFDLKVEFPGAPAQTAVRVAINGVDAASIAGKAALFAEREDGGDYSAYWIRDLALSDPGKYAVEATAGDKTARVTWEVFETGAPRAKNVILFIGDGLSVAHRTAARILSKGLVEGRYGGELAIDDMPHMALVSTSGTELGRDRQRQQHERLHDRPQILRQRARRLLRAQQGQSCHPRVETIAELVKRSRGMAVGVVTNTEIEDATPAAMVAHNRLRADYNNIVKSFFAVQPDVIMGGGTPNFLPQARPAESATTTKTTSAKFVDAGYTFVDDEHRARRRARQGAPSCSAFSTPPISTARSTASS